MPLSLVNTCQCYASRCPTECRLSYSAEPWKCLVSLRFLKDEHGQSLGQVRNEPFGPPIFKKEQVEDRIRRAQLAILNPKRDYRKYLDEDSEETDLTFSANCVSLQISGKDVADLSFVDLPGSSSPCSTILFAKLKIHIPGLIVSVAKGGNENDIELVKNLVSSYISKPSCLILLTVTCESQFPCWSPLKYN
jgi:hypothetical protein